MIHVLGNGHSRELTYECGNGHSRELTYEQGKDKEETQLSKHNYSQYSKPKQNNNQQHKPVEKVEPVIETVEVEKVVPTVTPVTTPEVVQSKPKLVQETVGTVTLPETVKGVVYNCAKLNVRENCTVDSPIVCVLDVKSEIEIDVNRSTDHWFYIHTAIGAEGYCMKQYVEARM